MGLGDAFQESTDTALRVMASRPFDLEPPKPKHSAWSVIPRAVAGAFVEVGGNIMDVASAYGQVVAATSANANPLIPESLTDRKERQDLYEKLKTQGINWQPEESRANYRMAQDLRPDPITAGTAENIVFAVTKGLTKAIGAGMITGPVAGAGIFGASEGLQTAEDLAAQGVDLATRTKAGAVSGVMNAAGMALPVAGKTLAGTAALVAVGGPAQFMAQQAATRHILQSADYGRLAQQFDPLDPVGLAVATLLPAGFATWAKLGAKGGTKPANSGTKPAESGTATPEQIDAAMVHNLTIARDAHEAAPPQDVASRMAARDVAGIPDQIPRAESLPPLDRQVETRLADKIAQDYPAAVREYSALPDAKGGKVLNVDTARELSPDYGTSRESRSLLSAAVHEPASHFIKQLYAEKLAELPKGATVMFTSGGTGAGKSTAINDVPSVKTREDAAAIVYDTNMNGLKSAQSKIEQAMAAGGNVEIVHVQRDPVDALVKGALPRAMRMGRAVPLDAHAATHIGAAETIVKLSEIYRSDPRVSIRVLDNTNGKGGANEAGIAFVKQFDYNNLRERLVDALHQEHQNGRINDAIYRGTIGQSGRESSLVRAPADARVSPGLPVRDGSGTANADAGGREAWLSAAGSAAREGSRRQELTAKAFPIRGKESAAVTERGKTIATQFVAVEADALITSHDNALKPNPAFPQELQPRDRARAASEAQISKIENAINPELLAESPKASDGAPIIGADKVVESGNARTIALRRAYETGKADGYRAWLIENAGRFGLDAKKLGKLKQPVLVRVGRGRYDRAEFARQANESAVAQMSVTEIAKADAARMPDLQGLVTNEDGSINPMQSGPFIRSFLSSAVSPSEHGAMMAADGSLSQQGLQRIRNAVFAKAYGDSELVAMMAESTDANVKNVLGGMLRAAPSVARLKELIDAGARFPRDITTDLGQAVQLFSQLRRDGMKVEQYLSQHGLFDSGPSPEVRSLLVGLEENARAPKRIAEMIGGYVDAVDRLGDPRQAGMFGDTPPPSGPDLVNSAIEAVRAANDVKPTADLFAQPQNKDPYLSSVISRVEELKAQHPDLPVAVREDGTPVRLADELGAIRRQAKEGTEGTFGADDAPLVQVAVECFLSMGSAAA